MYKIVNGNEVQCFNSHVHTCIHVYIPGYVPPSEINLKEQLVDQLEKAQKNLFAMKQQYEEKITLLLQQIHQVESERDKVLKDMSESILYIQDSRKRIVDTENGTWESFLM